MAREPIEVSEAFVTEVCWHYYINGNTQAGCAASNDQHVERVGCDQALEILLTLCGCVQVPGLLAFIHADTPTNTILTSLSRQVFSMDFGGGASVTSTPTSEIWPMRTGADRANFMLSATRIERLLPARMALATLTSR